MEDRTTPIIIEHVFSKTKEEVWKAITDPNEMRLWFFENMPDYLAKVGFETKFNVDAGERQFMHLWKITEVVPMQKLVCNWQYEGYEGSADVIYELEGDGGNSKLRVTVIGLYTFDSNIPEFTRESCEGGWHYFINQRLKEYFQK